MKAFFFRSHRKASLESTEHVTEVKFLRQQVESLHAEMEGLQMRFELIRRASGEGLWDMEVPADDTAGASNPFF